MYFAYVVDKESLCVDIVCLESVITIKTGHT